MLIKLLI